MKKTILIVLIIVVITLFFNQCNTRMDVSLVYLTAEGSYDSTTDETMVKIKVKLQNNTIILGRIFDWQFMCVDKDGNIIMQIFQENYRQLFCNKVRCDNVNLGVGGAEIVLETMTPKIGDVFDGNTPVRIVAWLAIEDENENGEILEPVATFNFTRK